MSYGFGWFLDPYRGHKRMSHDGETIGFRTTIQRFPDDSLTIIVLANRTDVNPEDSGAERSPTSIWSEAKCAWRQV